MTSPWFFDTVDSDSWRDDPPGSLDEIRQASPHLRPNFAGPLYRPLPDPDPNTHTSSLTYPPACGAPHPESPVVASPNPNTYTPFDFHGWPLQTELQPVHPFVDLQDSGSMPTTHQRFATVDSDRTLVPNDFREYPSPATNGSFPVHNPLYFSQAQFHSDGSCNSAMDTPYRQFHPAPASVVWSPSSILSDLASQPMVSRPFPAQVPPTRRDSWGGPSVTSFPHHRIPVRKYSLPVQSASPKEAAVPYTCQWMRDDGTPCGVQMTYTSARQHLRCAHGIKNMARNDPIPCRWLGCRPRGDKDTMNRESILRHVREKHLGRKRPTYGFRCGNVVCP